MLWLDGRKLVRLCHYVGRVCMVSSNYMPEVSMNSVTVVSTYAAEQWQRCLVAYGCTVACMLVSYTWAHGGICPGAVAAVPPATNSRLIQAAAKVSFSLSSYNGNVGLLGTLPGTQARHDGLGKLHQQTAVSSLPEISKLLPKRQQHLC